MFPAKAHGPTVSLWMESELRDYDEYSLLDKNSLLTDISF